MEVPQWAFRLALVLAGALSVGGLVALARPRGEWGRRLRRRFVVGVPWGTLLTIGAVLGFYLVAQGGLERWRAPLVIPFRAWSYFYPLGTFTAGLAHAGPGHLTGNLLGAFVFGSLAEYAWSHLPTGRGSESFRSLPEHPVARILAFPLACVAAAVVSGAFGLGPVIGFSGVVFAFAGFALVRYPVATVVLLVGSQVVDLAYRSLQSPVVPGSSGVSFSSPWWADVAIQGHAFGFLLGLVGGVLLFRGRGSVAPAGRIWFAALAFTAAKGMWAVYLIRGQGEYVLFRAAGLALLLLLAALVVWAALASDRDLVPALDLSRREAAVGLLAALLVALALVAVPYNLLTVDDAGAPADDRTVEVRDYTVFYTEDVRNRLVGAYDLPVVNTSGVTESGVVVTSQRRTIWWVAVPKGQLAFAGERPVRVGGLGWRDRVVAERRGWIATGGPTAYRVLLRTGDDEPIPAFASDGAGAEPTIRGRNVTVAPTDEGFDLVVSRGNETLGRDSIPATNETRSIGGLSFVRDENGLFATANDTRVRVATRETYGR